MAECPELQKYNWLAHLEKLHIKSLFDWQLCDEQDNAVLSTKLVYFNKGTTAQARLLFIIIIFIFLYISVLELHYCYNLTIKSKSKYAMFLLK